MLEPQTQSQPKKELGARSFSEMRTRALQEFDKVLAPWSKVGVEQPGKVFRCLQNCRGGKHEAC